MDPGHGVDLERGKEDFAPSGVRVFQDPGGGEGGDPPLADQARAELSQG